MPGPVDGCDIESLRLRWLSLEIPETNGLSTAYSTYIRQRLVRVVPWKQVFTILAPKVNAPPAVEEEGLRATGGRDLKVVGESQFRRLRTVRGGAGRLGEGLIVKEDSLRAENAEDVPSQIKAPTEIWQDRTSLSLRCDLLHEVAEGQ